MSQFSGSEESLFRAEVISVSNTQSFGNVLVHQPWGYRVAAILAALLIFLAIAFAYFGTHTRKATVTGLLMPEQGMLRLTSVTTGLLTEVRVSEGQHVEAGQVLFVISGERFSSTGGAQQLIAEQLAQRLLLLERNRLLADNRVNGQVLMLDSSLASIKGELQQFSEEVRLLQRRVELAGIHQQRQQKLVDAGFTSIAQMQQSEAELLTLQGQLQSSHRSRANLERGRTELLSQRQEAELRHRTEISDIDNTILLVRQEQAENDVRTEQIIVAPFAGTVTGMTVQVGQHITAGVLLASLIPYDATLFAHLYVAPRQAGFIELGQTVLIRYAAYPYQKFGMARGKVLSIARSPYAVQELPPHIGSSLQGASMSADLFYRVTVALDSQIVQAYGNQQHLQAGMLLEGDIVQDKRRLYEWALEPLYSVTGKFPDN